jgi:hypothetical protein
MTATKVAVILILKTITNKIITQKPWVLEHALNFSTPFPVLGLELRVLHLLVKCALLLEPFFQPFFMMGFLR